jgi:hypothetical protein
MKTIKKTTLIAAITAMAAIAVPSMASAAVWGPLNTNKTLTSTSSSKYVERNVPAYWSFECSSSTLGVHVRTPASSTLDITSATFTGCVDTAQAPCTGSPVTVTAMGLPWAVTTSGSNVTFTEHLQVNYPAPCGPLTLNVDGTMPGSYNNSTHTLTAQTPATPPMTVSLTSGPFPLVSTIYGGYVTTWKDATNSLNLT